MIYLFILGAIVGFLWLLQNNGKNHMYREVSEKERYELLAEMQDRVNTKMKRRLVENIFTPPVYIYENDEHFRELIRDMGVGEYEEECMSRYREIKADGNGAHFIDLKGDGE